MPGATFGCTTDCFHAGRITWINIALESFEPDGTMRFGSWSSLSFADMQLISNNLQTPKSAVLTHAKNAGNLLQIICKEITEKEMGYITRVNQLLYELLIMIGRRSARHDEGRGEFPHSFMQLEKSLCENLNHHWSVAEMAAMVGLGNTAFSEKVKNLLAGSHKNFPIPGMFFTAED